MADSKFLHIKGSRVQVYKTLPSNDVGNDGDIILSQIQGRGVYLCSKVNGKWHVSSKMEELRKIEKTSTKDFRTNKLRVLDDLSIGRGTTQITKDEAKFSSSLKIKEAANAISDTAAYGQLWVKTATPNQLYFTTDAGDDIQITSGTATAFVGDITSVVAGTNCSGGGTSGDVTINVDDAFLINNGSDTTTGTITAGGFTTTGTITMPELTDDAAIGITKIQDSGTSFTDNDTSIMTAAAIADKIEGYGYSTTAGDITGVTAGDGLSGGGTSGTVSLAVGVDDSTIETDSDVLRVKDAGVTLAKMADIADNRILGRYDEGDAGAPIALTASATRLLLNVADGATANTGDITGVTAGTNCSGGGTSGGVTINVDDAFIVNDADDTMVGTLTIDKNSSTSTTHSNYGEKIDLDFSGNPSSGQTVTNYGLDIDFDFTGANGTGGNTNSYGINIAMNAEAGSHSAASGIDNIGIKEVLTGDTETGDTTQRGFDCTITGGDVGSQIGLYLNTADGSTDYKAVSSADTADYFTIATTANGATTFTTVDGGAAAAHLNFNIDGQIGMNSTNVITFQSGAGEDIVFEDADDDIGQFSASGLTISNISEVPSDTDKFLMSHSGVVKYVTGANLLSYIGGQATVTAGTNCTFSGATLNVDDAFLKNDASDTTTGTITAGGFTTTGTWTMDTSAGGTTGITNINITNAFTDDDVTIMSAGAIKEKIEGYGYTTNAGDMTGVDLTGGTGISIDSETNTTSGAYSSTITCNLEGTELISTGEGGGSKFLREDGDGSCSWQTVSASGNFVTDNAADIMTVSDFGAVAALKIDADQPATAGAEDSKGLWIDYDRIVAASGTAAHNDIGIDLDVNAASLGTSSVIGMDIDVVGATSGTHTAIGIDLDVDSADTNIGMIINTAGTHLKLVANADADDYATFTLADTGDLTIATVGDGSADSDLTLEADGFIYFKGTSGGDGLQFVPHHSGDWNIQNATQDQSIQFLINDGGSNKTVMLIDGAEPYIKFDEAGVGFKRQEATFSATGIVGSGGTDDTDIDFRTGNKFRLELTGDITTVNLVFPSVSGNFLLVCRTDGDHDVTNWKVWESDESAATETDVLWAGGGSVPVFTDSGIDIVSFYWDADEQECYGMASLDFGS